jgi:Tol biopolymer transport system component
VQVTKSPADEMQPDWSPDGSTIAYWSAGNGGERGGVFLVPALGGVSRRLTDSGLRPRWSPDGTTIAFLSAEPFVATGVQPDVFTVPADGNAPARRALANAPNRVTVLLSAAWHPDGRLSVLGLKSAVPTVFTVVPGGSQMVETTLEAMNVPSQAPYDALYRRATWHPDGRRLFVEVDVQRVRTVFRVEIDPVSHRVLRVERLTSGSTNDTGAALSRDGKRLAYTVQTDSDRLTLIPFEAARRRVLGEGRPIGEPGTVPATAELSRDQNRVAYLLFRPGNTRRSELWSWDIARESGTQLTADTYTRVAPRWAPDGRRLVYSRAEGLSQQTQIVIRDGSTERPVAPLSANFVWQWPTDDLLLGSSLAPATQRFAVAAWRVNDAPDARPRLLASSPTHQLFQSQLSPNGRFIAFVAFPNDALGLGTIHVIPVEGAPPDRWVQVTRDGMCDKPRWAPDGRTVYFVSNAGGSFFNVWGVPFDEKSGTPVGRPFQLTHFERPTRMLSPRLSEADISVAADRLLVLIRESAGNIWVMDNVDD